MLEQDFATVGPCQTRAPGYHRQHTAGERETPRQLYPVFIAGRRGAQHSGREPVLTVTPLLVLFNKAGRGSTSHLAIRAKASSRAVMRCHLSEPGAR